jgi:quaternary ammonium compound-resistance protein SugE
MPQVWQNFAAFNSTQGHSPCKKIDTSFSMAWFILILGGLFEVGFTTCLAKAKESSGTTYVLWIIGFFVSMVMSMYLLYRATLTLPMGTAYAVWTGIGAAGTAIIGIVFFKEPMQIGRMFFLFTLIASIVGLKYVTH